MSQIFNQLNPFSQFVIEEIVHSQVKVAGEEAGEEEAEREWQLNEDIFKVNSQSIVDPEHLRKSSSQMFAVYKHYGDPTLKVRSKKYTGKDDFVEVKDLVAHTKFFDAPKKENTYFVPALPGDGNFPSLSETMPFAVEAM